MRERKRRRFLNNPSRLPYLVLIPLLLAGVAATAQEPRLEWAFETQGKIYASPILADLDGDGTPEIVVCASRDRRVICLDGHGELRWGYAIHDRGGNGIQATPSAIDYDGDGKMEVFFVDAAGVAGCIDYQGNLVWRTFTGDDTDYTGPVVADIDSDGAIEVVFGSESGTLYCLDDCGMEKWHYQGDGAIRGIPAVAYHEPSDSMRIYAVFSGGTAACLSSVGKVVWSHHEPAPRNERRSGPAIGDLDGDGTPEVVLATEDFKVIVREAFTGEERWRWKGLSGIDQTNSFALVDFDGSGKLDIVCADGGGQGGPGHVYRLRDGQSLWTADAGGGVVQGPSVGDVDGDGYLEILVCSRSKRLICFSSDGAEEWSYPSEAGSLTTPAIGDVDGDGKTEIIFTSKDHWVRCLTVDGDYNAARVPWPMMNHDPQLTGNAGAPARLSYATETRNGKVGGRRLLEARRRSGGSDQHEEIKEQAIEILRFGPLRSGDNRVAITFTKFFGPPQHLELVAEVLRPDDTRISQTVSEQCTVDSPRRVEFNVPTLRFFSIPGREVAEYTMTVRLVDVGTGKTLATEEAIAEYRPWDVERREFQALSNELDRLQGRMPPGPARDRLKTAFNYVDIPAIVEAGFEQTRALDPYTTREQWKAAIVEVNALLRRFGRDVARMRAAVWTPGEAQDFAVVPETTLRKVFKDEPYFEAGSKPSKATITVAGNELEGVQLVVVPLWKDLKNLRVSVSGLAHNSGAGQIPGEDVIVNRVGYIPIGPPEYNWHVEKVGDYPDVLFPDGPYDVPADQDAQPYFVTVRAREDTAAGNYTGVVRFEADDCAPVEIPLRIHVWDFALSKETHLKTSMWMSEGYIQRFYQYEGRTPFEVRKRFYDMHLDHRVGPIKDFPLDGGAMLEDFEYLIDHGQNNFFIPVPEWLEPDNREELAGQYQSTRALLDEKGWNDLALFYTRDEVAVMGRHVMSKVVEMNHWIKTVIPEWPRLQTSAPEQALFDAVDVWCPTIDHFDPVVLQDRMGKGERLWFYTVWGRPGIMIEFPATDHRLMFWACWKYDAEGFLYWGTTHWDLNMTTDQRWPDIPWISYNRQPGHNGCGYLLYPGPNGTPLSSIRFELVRDGIEDYEYLHLLRGLFEKAGDRCPVELARTIQSELSVLRVMEDQETFTEDPQVILDARRRIAGLIEELQAIAGVRSGT